jgi:hypothetical protein
MSNTKAAVKPPSINKNNDAIFPESIKKGIKGLF